MFIYSEIYFAVIFVPIMNDGTGDCDRVAIWLVPGVERNGEGYYGIDSEFNRPPATGAKSPHFFKD